MSPPHGEFSGLAPQLDRFDSIFSFVGYGDKPDNPLKPMQVIPPVPWREGGGLAAAESANSAIPAVLEAYTG
ncbi:MAG: hypothetical protein ACRD41_13745, partial [Candidatus Acidiferrales bacterium]